MTAIPYIIPNPLGPIEQGFDPTRPHQDLRGPGGMLIAAGQGTMRAHHIADHVIQTMVCHYINGPNNNRALLTLLDRLSALYLTSWIDVVVTPRLFRIWLQWAGALFDSFHLVMSRRSAAPLVDQASNATELCKTLSSSVANLRVGHGQTDSALGHAIAPRLQRGQFDLIGYFIGWLNSHNFAQPTLSVETSLACAAWGNHFVINPLTPSGTNVVVNNVFVGPAPGGNLFISEEDPILPNVHATRPLPQLYPGTQSGGRYVLRATRATLHRAVVVAILAWLVSTGLSYFNELVWPKGL